MTDPLAKSFASEDFNSDKCKYFSSVTYILTNYTVIKKFEKND